MRMVEEAFFELDAPVRRVCSAEVPIPYAAHLEQAALPQPATIAAAGARGLVRPSHERVRACPRSAPTWKPAPWWSG